MLEKLLQKRINRWILSALTGLLLVVSFPETGSITFLAFVAWIPLLFVENNFFDKRKAFALFLHAYFAFFIYNVGTTWWIYFASAGGAYMAFLANSLLMAIFFTFFHLLKRRVGKHWGGFIFVSTWICFEYMHFHWELSWPWLTIGNVFAIRTNWVQWYDTTGVLGGTLWVLLINVLLFLFLLNKKTPWYKSRVLQIILMIFTLPLLWSYIKLKTNNPKSESYEVAVLQPNIDPYEEKFTGNNQDQLTEMLDQADKVVTKKTKLVIAPETALYPTSKIYEQSLRKETFTHQINERRAKWNKAGFLIGASTFQSFDTKISAAAKYYKPLDLYLEDYNSSLLFDNTANPKIIHKSKLVLGVEKIPFVNTLPFLEQFAVEMEGGSGTLGIENNPKIFTLENIAHAPAVCYESVYGEWVAKQTKLGAQFIAVITNDGWWKDTPGYKQHFDFARLRAIETNKYVVQSANTGTSGVISNTGEVLKKTGWWVKDQFVYTLKLNQTITTYQKFGDMLGFVGAICTFSFLLLYLFKRIASIKRKSFKG